MEPYITYMPTYQISVVRNELKRLYFGALQMEGKPLRFRQILDKYYNGEVFPLLFTMTWGGYELRDVEIL